VKQGVHGWMGIFCDFGLSLQLLTNGQFVVSLGFLMAGIKLKPLFDSTEEKLLLEQSARKAFCRIHTESRVGAYTHHWIGKDGLE